MLSFPLVLVVLVGAHGLASRSNLSPSAGAAAWLSILALRAAVTISIVLAVFAEGWVGQVFTWFPAWCFHAAAPVSQIHLGFSGHALGDIASILPATALVVSLAASGLGMWLAARAVAAWLAESTLGDGPAGSTMVRDPAPMLGAAGVMRPVVVVSAPALVSLDDAELAAALQHEWGHIRRFHRLLMLLAGGLMALSRPLPGGRAALGRVRFYLERDADEYAVRQTGDALSLASAICKVAIARTFPVGPAFASLGAEYTAARLRVLLGHDQRPRQRSSSLACVGALIVILAAVVVLTSIAPVVAATGLDQLHVSLGSAGCG